MLTLQTPPLKKSGLLRDAARQSGTEFRGTVCEMASQRLHSSHQAWGSAADGGAALGSWAAQA